MSDQLEIVAILSCCTSERYVDNYDEKFSVIRNVPMIAKHLSIVSKQVSELNFQMQRLFIEICCFSNRVKIS